MVMFIILNSLFILYSYFFKSNIKIKVSGKYKEDKIKFYSALYHSMLSPTKWSEANGTYIGFGIY